MCTKILHFFPQGKLNKNHMYKNLKILFKTGPFQDKPEFRDRLLKIFYINPFLKTKNPPKVVNAVATEQKCYYLYVKAIL